MMVRMPPLAPATGTIHDTEQTPRDGFERWLLTETWEIEKGPEKYWSVGPCCFHLDESREVDKLAGLWVQNAVLNFSTQRSRLSYVLTIRVLLTAVFSCPQPSMLECELLPRFSFSKVTNFVARGWD